MNDTDLFGRERKYTSDGLRKAFEIVSSRYQNILNSSGFQVREDA